MVKKIDSLFMCEECKLKYEDEMWARKCEDWCAKNHTCNLDICKHSV